MGDIDRRWPAWKFGMKQNDLFTKLHDQYNTFPSSIQDPEAFHHDVYEISTTATDVDQFHSMLANRKIQRLQELNDALESAALEIIANPNLIGTEQWAFAVQLFRTRSLDSLVRYFASYLPSSHPWHKGGGQPDETDGKQQKQQGEQQQHQTTTFFDEAVVTHEPLSIADGFSSDEDVRSPRSLTTYSDDSDSTNLTSSRTLSFSESEPDQIDLPVYCKPDFSKQPTAHVEVVDSDVVVAVAVTDKKESTAAAEPIVVKLDELLAVEPVQVTETKQAVAVKNSDNTDATTNSNKTAFTSPTFYFYLYLYFYRYSYHH